MTRRMENRPDDGPYYTVNGVDEGGVSKEQFVKVEDVYLPGDAPLERHDQLLHIWAGGFGKFVPECNRCQQTKDMPGSIVCPVCRRRSWNVEDVWQGFCGGCNAYTSEPWRRRK
jgi:hypothetical protein